MNAKQERAATQHSGTPPIHLLTTSLLPLARCAFMPSTHSTILLLFPSWTPHALAAILILAMNRAATRAFRSFVGALGGCLRCCRVGGRGFRERRRSDRMDSRSRSCALLL